MERIIQGDCLDVLKGLPDNSVDAVVTDPPYGLSKEPDIREVLEKWLAGEDYHHRGGGFMGKTWDSFVPGPSIWREVFRVLKPGGHLLCFAGTRTQDLMGISLRLAGFEIRDCISWLFFGGFPKSFDVGKGFDKRAGAEREVIEKKEISGGGLGTLRLDGFSTLEELKEAAERGEKCPNGRDARKTYERALERLEKMSIITAPATELARKWDGWGSALKPAHEPILLCRKPLDGSICDNVERWGTGAINIGACRIPYGEDENIDFTRKVPYASGTLRLHGFSSLEELRQAAERGEKCPDGRDARKTYERAIKNTGFQEYKEGGRFPANCITTEPDMFYSKYFNITPPELCKKASKKDRNSDWQGNEIGLPERKAGGLQGRNDGSLGKTTYNRNTHPTVKPTDLMAWLCRLITPPGGIVLDPFAGSGSTLVAAKREGFGFIGIEKEPEYIEICKARVGA